MSNLGLSVNDVVNGTVSLSPSAAATRNFGIPLILGDSGVIDTQTRFRIYSSLTAVGGDYGGTSPEYLGAQEFFENNQSGTVYVGAWAANPTSAWLVGAVLSSAQQAIANFNTISNGGIVIIINGSTHTITNLNLTGVTNLNAVATALTIALNGAATCTWNANNNFFQILTTLTGPTASIGFATLGAGTDLSVLMGLSATVSGSYVVPAIAAEAPLVAAQLLATMTTGWYGLSFKSTTAITDAQHTAVANFIQAVSPPRIYGITTAEGAVLNGGTGTSIGNSLTLNRTYCQYSSATPAADLAAFGIAFTTNFLADDSLYTLMAKDELGVLAENLTETQAANLKAANCNVFVEYNNGKAILQWGTMTDGTYFDVIHGTDWLSNAIQVAIFNLLYTNRKLPQTDAGVSQIVATIALQCAQGVANGLIAPGTWNGPPIGQIATGDFLPLGYYIYAPPVSSQSQSARAARQSPVLTCCIKLAGAIHTVNYILNVNQ